MIDYDSFRAATLRTFFFRFSRGSKRVKANWNKVDRQHLSYLPVKQQAGDFKQSTSAFLQGNDNPNSRLEMTTRSLLNLH